MGKGCKLRRRASADGSKRQATNLGYQQFGETEIRGFLGLPPSDAVWKKISLASQVVEEHSPMV